MTRSVNAERLKPCMPPFIDEETKNLRGLNSTFSGTSCESLVKSYFLFNNINVYDPNVDDGVDLLVEKPEGLMRGQVKKVVYQSKLDYTHKKNFGGEIYRTRFGFSFQSGGGIRNRRQRKIGEIDYFYHVIATKYRTLIWETPASMVTLRKNGEFVSIKNLVLDRDSWIRKKSDINFNPLLIYKSYDPIIFQTFPEFFGVNTKNTLNKFFV